MPGGVKLGAVRGHDATHYPLSLMVRPGDELTLRLDYRPDLFDRGSVAVLGERLIRLLEGAVAEPDRPIGRLALLSEAERRHAAVAVERNRAAGCRQHAAGAVRGAGCTARPRRWRWCSRTVTLSYAELEAHSNQLAHHLRGSGGRCRTPWSGFAWSARRRW